MFFMGSSELDVASIVSAVWPVDKGVSGILSQREAREGKSAISVH